MNTKKSISALLSIITVLLTSLSVSATAADKIALSKSNNTAGAVGKPPTQMSKDQIKKSDNKLQAYNSEDEMEADDSKIIYLYLDDSTTLGVTVVESSVNEQMTTNVANANTNIIGTKTEGFRLSADKQEAYNRYISRKLQDDISNFIKIATASVEINYNEKYIARIDLELQENETLEEEEKENIKQLLKDVLQDISSEDITISYNE